jgi:outer membrane lipoprotein-sorting protein
VDRATNDYVFDLTYFQPKWDDTSRHRVWVDPEKRFTTKREWYSQHGRHLATFYYEKAVLQAGVWMPTVVTVRNADNKVAGVMEYTRVKVNGGLNDSLFAIN